jgi:hypothetical protein
MQPVYVIITFAGVTTLVFAALVALQRVIAIPARPVRNTPRDTRH